jgi:hypothetical protein
MTEEWKYQHSWNWKDKDTGVGHLVNIRGADVTEWAVDCKAFQSMLEKKLNPVQEEAPVRDLKPRKMPPNEEWGETETEAQEPPLEEPKEDDGWDDIPDPPLPVDEVSAFDVPDEEEAEGEPVIHGVVLYVEDFCHYHDERMEKGKFGYDHRTDDGWCKGNWCKKHGVTFHLRHGRGDRADEMWWSHQCDDEKSGYCNGGDAKAPV